MKNASKLYIPVFSIVFLVSLYFKTASIGVSVELAMSSPTIKNMELAKSVKPVNRGNFEILFYQSKACEGILALISLHKNEEGAAILAHYLKRPLSDVRFIYGEKIYSQFPAFSYWLGTLNPMKSSSPVFAVKEFGHCKLIETTDWSQI